MLRSILKPMALAAFVAIAPPAHADIGSDLRDFWERTGGGMNVSRPTAYQGQQGGFVSMGSLYLRTKPRNSGLLNIQLPSVRAGCGGIDLFGGAFSFISKEELVLLMKGIMQNAAGFAFELALESLSPTVAENVSKLRDLIQKVNAMNINSCEAGQVLAAGLWPKLDSAKNSICQTVGTMQGMFADRVASKHGCTSEGRQTNTLAAAQGPLAEQVPTNVNYAWRAIQKNAFLSSDRQLAELFMTLTGTIITTAPADDNQSPGQRKVPPKAFTGEMVRALVEGGSAQLLVCNDTDKCLNPTYQTVSISADKALYKRVYTVISKLSDAFANDTALTPDMAAIIDMTSVPVYDVLKTARAYKYQFVEDDIVAISELVAVDLAMRYVSESLQTMTTSAGNIDIFGEIIREFQDDIHVTQQSFGVYRREAFDRYNDALASLQKLQEAKGLLAASSTTRFGSMFGE